MTPLSGGCSAFGVVSHPGGSVPRVSAEVNLDEHVHGDEIHEHGLWDEGHTHEWPTRRSPAEPFDRGVGDDTVTTLVGGTATTVPVPRRPDPSPVFDLAAPPLLGELIREPEPLRSLFDGRSTQPRTLAEVVGQTAGAVSACWEHLDRAGEFQSEQASRFVEEAVAWIEEHYVPRTEFQRGVGPKEVTGG